MRANIIKSFVQFTNLILILKTISKFGLKKIMNYDLHNFLHKKEKYSKTHG